jgi:Lon protease-like protein
MINQVEMIKTERKEYITSQMKDGYSKIPTMDPNFMACSSCMELLFEPVTLPCGNVICSLCIKSDKYYSCPALKCSKIHYHRNESVNVLLQHCLMEMYPLEQKSLKLVKEAEQQLSKRECGEQCIPFQHKNRVAEMEAAIETLLNPAIKSAPYLQLPYLIRSKVYCELDLFDKAMDDAKKAHACNPNGRGLEAQKLVLKKMADVESDDSDVTLHEASLENETKPNPHSNTTLYPLPITSLDCHICLSTLHEPITTPCGHSYCRECILEWNGTQCPLCRVELPQMGYFLKRPIDKGLESILRSFPDPEPSEAKKDQKSIRKIPVFVCSLVFPQSAQSFHIFEPRYRTMVKYCLDNNTEFGIVLPARNQNGCQEIGTMVKIMTSQTVDGSDYVETSQGVLPRYVIHTVGTSRFRILEKSMNADGYVEALVETLNDDDIEDIDHDPVHFSQLQDQAREFVTKLLDKIPPTARLYFERRYGSIPQDVSRLSYWIGEILPVEEIVKYKLLEMDVIKRIELVCKWFGDAKVAM